MSIAIFGATSAIARQVAVQFAKRGDALILAARNGDELERLANDLSIRYEVDVQTIEFDATKYKEHERLVLALPHLKGALLAFGYLGKQAEAEENWEESARILETNFVGACSLLGHLCKRFETQNSGWIGAITSVAGDRGRKSNYIYGAAKGALSLYLQGMRHRLGKSCVRVIDFKLGCVDTPMIRDAENVMFVTSPEKVAKQLLKQTKKATREVYLPWFWKPIMKVICSIPERIFVKMEL